MKLGGLQVLITGGAGFIGSNLAQRLLQDGARVVVFDNLSRPGARANLAWLQSLPTSKQLEFIKGDLREFDKLAATAKSVDRIYHLAGQVAVTTSVTDPRLDFECNALGTFNALEAARQSGRNPVFLYASTNKVYGSMEDVETIEENHRWVYKDLPYGVSEARSLDFHSPYGCSKGAGDQYVRDYARIYGLRTVVLRQSCIYGYRQFGVEDQGWVAWFLIAALQRRPIHIYGDGKQVRDVLFIEDLLDVYELAVNAINQTVGQVYNIGGGPDNTLSIWSEFGPMLEKLHGHPISVDFADGRPGDQRVFVSDIRKAANDFQWQPRISVQEGIRRLFVWVETNRRLFSTL